MNKKLITSFIAGTAAFSMLSTAALAAINVVVDGNSVNFDVPPAIINDRTMVPMRAIFEALGAEVEWDSDEQAVYAQKDDTVIVLIIGVPYMAVNEDIIELDTEPVITDGRTLVPVRAISEAFNLSVNWDGNTQTVIIGEGSSQNDAAVPTQAPYTDTSQTAPVQDNSVQNMGLQVLELVNQYRTQAGLGTLVWDDNLAGVAQLHSNDMVARGFFDHVNPDGIDPFGRMRNYGISYMAAAENIAAGQTTAQAVMDSWMNSPGHYANIMNGSYNKMGIGIAYGGSYGIYWTQCFTN